MAKHESIEQKAEETIQPILDARNISLVDCEYVKEAGTMYLRFYIDKEGGVDIDDCVDVSRAYSDIVDVNDFIDEAYTLEVSSPGLGRPLKKDKDFNRNLDCDVEIRLYRAENGLKELVGTLKAFDKASVTIETEAGEMVLDRKNISMIREYVDWDA